MNIQKKMTKRCRALVMSGYGLNCEEETKFAFEKAGGQADIVHINDLIKQPKMLARYQILAFPGGFSYGDDTGSGKAYALKFKNHLARELQEFLARDTLLIGICNGFQIVTNLGILPGALTYNKIPKYLDRWVDLKVPHFAKASRGKVSPWLVGIDRISLPIAHGEGRYVMSKKGKTSVALKYVKGEICKFQNLEKNPNGSQHDIAGVLAYNGRVLGLMPHPERAIFFHHSPLWQTKKEKLKRAGEKIPEAGEGIILFKNAVRYFK
jgi:phosphoribosylformylglycinamidine synthase subunit PurQ / glutaminase